MIEPFVVDIDNSSSKLVSGCNISGEVSMDCIEKFKINQLQKARKNESRVNEWRKSFISEYPRSSLISIPMNKYLISRSGTGYHDSFCRRICFGLKSIFHINLGNSWSDVFGISLKNGTQLTLSKPLADKFDRNYNKAFIQIRNEITNLLDSMEKNDYIAVKGCELHSYFKYILLIIYFPDKILPVCSQLLLHRYCESLCIKVSYNEEMIYIHNELLNCKNAIPEISFWSNSIFASFCDWLYRKNMTIDSKLLIQDIQKSIGKTIEEVDSLKLQGKEKEAIVKVRINQSFFRDRLLQRYKMCCLCGVSNQSVLVASHIKPWSESDPDEKLDSDNGFLMCPNHDKLFDQGLISFDDDGSIIISDRLSEVDRLYLNVSDNMKVSLTNQNKKYLQYHRKKFFNT